MACLQVKVTMKPLQINMFVGIICNPGNKFEPLLVDEGYLFVKENGIIFFLAVNKDIKL